jgi:hypothetical protein
MLTGRPPFVASTWFEAEQQIQRQFRQIVSRSRGIRGSKI